jgi:hypothetical protein
MGETLGVFHDSDLGELVVSLRNAYPAVREYVKGLERQNELLRQDWRTLTDALHHDGIIDDNGEPTDMIPALRARVAELEGALGEARARVVAVRALTRSDSTGENVNTVLLARIDALLKEKA